MLSDKIHKKNIACSFMVRRLVFILECLKCLNYNAHMISRYIFVVILTAVAVLMQGCR